MDKGNMVKETVGKKRHALPQTFHLLILNWKKEDTS